jgi:S1-C subfamily serine protease
MFKRVFVGAAMICAMSSAFAHAQDSGSARVYVDPQPTVRLGFFGGYNGYGMFVNQVQWGSTAHRIGLESGDVILAINGWRITGDYQYQSLLTQSGGRCQLTVRDVRTGNIVYLYAFLGGP